MTLAEAWQLWSDSQGVLFSSIDRHRGEAVLRGRKSYIANAREPYHKRERLALRAQEVVLSRTQNITQGGTWEDDMVLGRF